MAYTELERISAELDWFMELSDALNDGRIEEATDSVGEAVRELRRLRKLLKENVPIDRSTDLDHGLDVQLSKVMVRVSKAERLAAALRRYLEQKPQA